VFVLLLPIYMHAQIPKQFAGRWVSTLANKPFLVLSLSTRKDKPPLTGYMLRPAHLQTSDGLSYSRIGGATSKRPIVGSEMKNAVLTIKVQNSGHASDIDELQLKLTDPTHLAMTIKGAPFPPRIFTKTAKEVVPATDWDENKTYSDEDVMASNPKMQRIYDADQNDRESPNINWGVVSKADEQRREQTRKLLADGVLHTGKDFEHAAFVFQHGSTPNDYLLAHTLAMVAVKKGEGSAIWIAAATLDRYLQSIKQPQIFGTQFLTPANGPVTQEPYDRTLVSDALRQQLSVPSQAMQEQQLKKYQSEADSRK
jgi:hypothetical protein